MSEDQWVEKLIAELEKREQSTRTLVLCLDNIQFSRLEAALKRMGELGVGTDHARTIMRHVPNIFQQHRGVQENWPREVGWPNSGLVQKLDLLNSALLEDSPFYWRKKYEAHERQRGGASR